ncbi:MAG: hypothetical protein ACE5RF_03495 [Nitrosarchaeum sp.]
MHNISMFWVITNKKRVNEVREETRKGFESVKKDITSVSKWIKHLDSEKESQKNDINSLKQAVSSMNKEIEELRETVNMMSVLTPNSQNKQMFKTNSYLSNKQTDVFSVQTGVQTGVQTPNLSIFSITERAIIGVLLNSDMKLSYEDLAALLGKGKSTIRGQINTIKSKNDSIITENIEKNGKKRVYIPQEIKEKLLKKRKVRVNPNTNYEKDEENY